jgi:transcriptional regulator with PAS, ATPase and Fis domain
LQVKLLRILQEGEFERVGDTKTIKVNVRVIAASNQKLEKMINEGRFREDLYYRLNVISIELPPLKERRGDMRLLAEYFIQKHNKDSAKRIKGITKEALEILERYDWPGNVRELENVVERAMVLSHKDTIDKDVLPEILHKNVLVNTSSKGNNTLKEILEEPERDIIYKTLQEVKGNKKKAASKLGINRSTLYNKIRKYGLTE